VKYIRSLLLVGMSCSLFVGCASNPSRTASEEDRIKALKAEKLTAAQKWLEKAKDADADDYAPKSYEYAQKTLEAADKLIESNPSATADVDAKSEEATFFAQRAFNLGQHAKQMDGLKPEERVLWVERHAAKLTELFGEKDLRSASLDDQFVALENRATQLHAQQSGMTQESKKLQTSVADLNRELKSTRPHAELDKKITSLRSSFSPSEADVLRSGDQVTLRLKSINFAAGKSQLGKENYSLLKKVRESLALFPEAAITVEGHTDSAGSASLNEKLSTERAENVKAYLVSSDAVTAENVEAVGKGFEVPIATNKTREGRAANRRIDLVINVSGDAQTSNAEAEAPAPVAE